MPRPRVPCKFLAGAWSSIGVRARTRAVRVPRSAAINPRRRAALIREAPEGCACGAPLCSKGRALEVRAVVAWLKP